MCTERNGRISGYIVEFQREGRTLNTSEVIGQDFTANGLTPYTNYTFRVAGVNSNGTGPYSDTLTITTNEDSK